MVVPGKSTEIEDLRVGKHILEEVLNSEYLDVHVRVHLDPFEQLRSAAAACDDDLVYKAWLVVD